MDHGDCEGKGKQGMEQDSHVIFALRVWAGWRVFVRGVWLRVDDLLRHVEGEGGAGGGCVRNLVRGGGRSRVCETSSPQPTQVSNTRDPGKQRQNNEGGFF